MKINWYVMLVCFCCFLTSANAQRQYHSAVGLRLGAPTGISYKQFINDSDAMEMILGRRSKENYSVTSFSIGYQIHETDVDEFINWYYGAAAGVYVNAYDSSYTSSKDANLMLGINGVFGVDYKFNDFPVNLDIQWSPIYTFGNVAQKGIRLGCFGFSMRYVLTED